MNRKLPKHVLKYHVLYFYLHPAYSFSPIINDLRLCEQLIKINGPDADLNFILVSPIELSVIKHNITK